MRMVSTPKPRLAARASPEIFRRIRLNMGVGIESPDLTVSKSSKFQGKPFPVFYLPSNLATSETLEQWQKKKNLAKKRGAVAPQNELGGYLTAGVAASPPSPSCLVPTKATVALASPS